MILPRFNRLLSIIFGTTIPTGHGCGHTPVVKKKGNNMRSFGLKFQVLKFSIRPEYWRQNWIWRSFI